MCVGVIKNWFFFFWVCRPPGGGLCGGVMALWPPKGQGGSATGFRMKKKQSEEQATSFLFSPWELKKTKGKVLQWEHGEHKRN